MIRMNRSGNSHSRCVENLSGFSFHFYLLFPLIMKTFLAILLLLVISSCSQQPNDRAQTDQHLRLITYNVWYGFTKAPDRKETWINWMKEQQSDVVSLQELNEYTPGKLAQDAEKWGHPHTVLLKEGGFPTGITSRFPIEDIQRYLEGFHHGLLRVNIKGIYFYVIHLHPSNWEVRTREIGLILDNIEGLPQGAKVILAGDFNTFSSKDADYYAHGRLAPFFHSRDVQYKEHNLKAEKLDYSVLERLYNLGWTDLEYQFRSADYRFTGTFPSKVEKEGEHGDLRRLDYVFASPNLIDQIVDANIIANDTTQVLSDHLPVRVDLSW